MTANVRIVLEAKEGVLTIPVAALGDRREDGTYSVRVLGEGDEVRTADVVPGINNRSGSKYFRGSKPATGLSSESGAVWRVLEGGD